jgi:hypothetical protein
MERSDNQQHRRRKISFRQTGVASLILALIVCGLFENRLDLYRHLFQFLVVCIPIYVLLNLPRLLKQWRGLLTMLITSALCLFIIWLAGPLLVRHFVMPMYHLDVDHRPRPSFRGTNEDGLYTDLTSADIAEDDFSIVFLGDSYTEGYKVSREVNFVETVGRRLRARHPDENIKVVNFGWVSSSPVLQLRLLHSIGEKYKPDLVVQVFDMGDFHNDLVASKMLRDEHGLDHAREISVFDVMLVRFSTWLGVPNVLAWLKGNLAVFDSPDEEPSDIPQKRFFHMFQPLAESEPYLDLSWHTIVRIHQWAEQRNAKFVLFVPPRYPQHDRDECPDDLWKDKMPESDEYVLEAFEYFAKKAGTVDFPVQSMLEPFRRAAVFPLCFENDPHWNENGHRVAADAIAQFLIEQRFLEE